MFWHSKVVILLESLKKCIFSNNEILIFGVFRFDVATFVPHVVSSFALFQSTSSSDARHFFGVMLPRRLCRQVHIYMYSGTLWCILVCPLSFYLRNIGFGKKLFKFFQLLSNMCLPATLLTFFQRTAATEVKFSTWCTTAWTGIPRASAAARHALFPSGQTTDQPHRRSKKPDASTWALLSPDVAQLESPEKSTEASKKLDK